MSARIVRGHGIELGDVAILAPLSTRTSPRERRFETSLHQAERRSAADDSAAFAALIDPAASPTGQMPALL